MSQGRLEDRLPRGVFLSMVKGPEPRVWDSVLDIQKLFSCPRVREAGE